MQDPQTNRFPEPRWSVLWWIALVGIVGVAAWFRWQFIDLRPVHTDEAENAYILAKDISGEGYRFSPKHHHGPTLNLLLHVAAKSMGYHDYAGMEIVPLRAVLWGLGVGTLLLILSLRSIFGNIATVGTTVVAGFSALLTYYGNYVIHETLLGFVSILLLWLFVSFVLRPAGWKVGGIGILVGILFATKITSLILFASWGFAAVVMVGSFERDWAKSFSRKQWLSWGGILVLTACGMSALLYTSFFRNPEGFWDAIRSVWVYETEAGHGKPWSYFFTHFVFPMNQPVFGSYEWGLWGFGVIGIVGLIIPRFRESMGKRIRLVATFLSVSVGFQLVVYSCVAYKTPWLLLVTWIEVSLLTGVGLHVLWHGMTFRFRGVWVVLFIALLSLQIQQTRRLNGVWHSDPRNPLAYAPTSVNVVKLKAFLDRQAAGLPGGATIGVYGAFMWPLPWYLRDLEGVAYRTTFPEDNEASVLILNDDTYQGLRADGVEHLRIYPYTLRPNVPVYVCVRNYSDSEEE